ncbi:MAG: hypothetical protein KDK26_02665 [Roseivivax sp.]|nr:hypothetical protein [Roseivivax sp.]
MFARVTPYKMKPSATADAEALMHKLKDQIMALPGVKQFVNVMDDTGKGYVISLVESREISDGNQEKSKAIWAHFGPHLEAMPTAEGYDVLANWKP